MVVYMATKNPRINVTFNQEIVDTLSFFAKKEHKSVAALTKALVLHSLGLKEDMALSKIAHELDIEGTKTISHEEVWK